ncbi:SIR2 family protein [Xanthomonas arboricola]|uniref:SIR2 family protein n=1 Tax=Xanthomonas arboricola TaxID=56448 RepID=UPI001187833E|nr:SIR2 family protein [Xanthomonas arboricola]QDS14318.1 hypothetical protein FPL04_00640 [Xanthomonas arboricola]
MASAISISLEKFFKSADYPIIFTGAGVSVRAGLPTWKTLIEKMAAAMQAHDPMISQIMLQCVRDGEFTKAVDYFNLTSKMLDGDKLSLLRILLKEYDSNKISPIARLPFRACVTTNFDKSIHDAIAVERKRAAIDYKYGDSSFKQAQWEDGLFVARIHGAAEVPASMILSEAHFSKILADENYQHFLRTCFVHRNVLFLGFSFYDPAIRSVFEEIDRQFGPATPGRHMVLLPESSSVEFLQKANRLNIEVVKYSEADSHKELWQAVDNFNRSDLKVHADSHASRPLGPAKRFLAACFARAKTRDRSRALKEAITEGIVSAMLQEAAPGAISRMDLLEKIRTNLGLKKSESEVFVDSAIRSLIEADLCRKMKSGQAIKFSWQGDKSDEDSLEFAIGKLSKSLEQRAFLQEKWRFEERLSNALPEMFSQLVRTRGWDLGASFAAGKVPDPVSVESAIGQHVLPLSAFDRERLLRVFLIMLQNPTEEEARILGELGRVSFALEMAFQAPQSTLLHNAILPHRIFFDASVLLPALVEGHPFSRVYSEAIDRLKNAAASAAVDMRLAVCTVYLNEMISHRRAAEAIRQEYGNDFEKMARMDALYHGPTNTNVYIGAYANYAHNNESISFDAYLKKYAPYQSELDLKKWLQGRGFEVVEAPKTSRYSDLYGKLEIEYANSLANGKKKPLLIEHDAIQIARIESEIARGDRVLFVTADRQLREFVSKIGLTNVADGMISNVGLVQFIELVIGGNYDGAGMTELLWNTRISDKAMAVRSYFTNVALQMYDDGMAMAMPDIVESYSDQSVQEMARQGFDLDSEEPKGRAKAFQKLGTLEASYFKGMSQAVEKIRKRLEE